MRVKTRQAKFVGTGYNPSAMCGRYSLKADLGELAGRFEFDGERLGYALAYNIAPTHNVLTVVGGVEGGMQ